MISPLPSSYTGGSSRRVRYSPSPSGGIPPSKRSKPSSSTDRNHANESDEHRTYTSICVKRINPKISDIRVRELCEKKFSKYGTNSIKIYRKSHDRVAFINFTNIDDARRAQQARTGLVWEGMQVYLEPVFYRKTIPADQPISPGSLHERFSSNRRSRPSPPPIPSRKHSHRHSSSRRQRSISPPSPPARSSRRPYSPYIPLPPDLIDYTDKKSSGQRPRSSPSPVRRHHHSRSPNNHRSDNELIVQNQPSRTLFIENLERNITESKLEEIFKRYGTIEELNIKKSSSTSKRACALIRFENMEMAYKARQAMDGKFIGENVGKIGYGV